MFSSKNKASSRHYDTLISKKTEIMGNVKFSGGLQVEGVIKGNLIAEPESGAIVRISDGARVEGQINAPNVVVNGTVIGDVYATDYIELAKKAHIEGNVFYHLMEMVLGAEVNGKLLHRAKDELKQENASKQDIDVINDQSGDKID